MTIKIMSEDELLNQETRKKLIECWDDKANQIRKREAFKAYECLKDKTSNYVMELLLKQFDTATVIEMQYAISNVSILRKVIDKLAKVYANGVKRTMPDKGETEGVEKAAEVLKMNEVMKKANRYFRTFKNTLVYVRPMRVEDKYTLKIEAKAPFYYDVVENPDNPEEPLAVVLSDYCPTRESIYALGDAAVAGRQIGTVQKIQQPVQNTKPGVDPEDDNREFIWWTKKFHFTTNAKGEIINKSEDETGENPIGVLPFVNFAGEQDGTFWAEGGADLVDAGIKINTMISNVSHVAVAQGYGQMYMTGKNLPKSVKVGPTHCIQLEQNEGEPAPTVGYLNSNPPVSDLRDLIEMDVALMLSTNNLSTSGFSMSLKGSKEMASGVALLIDRSESIEDVGEQSKIFIEKEPKVWALIGAWLGVYKSRQVLVEEVATLKLPAKPELVQLKFSNPQPVVSELDELTAIEKRQSLGLNTRVELLMRDDPSLSEEEAKAKLALIDAEKQAKAAAFGLPGKDGTNDDGTGTVGKPGAMGADSGDMGGMGNSDMTDNNEMDGMNGNQGQKGDGKPGQDSGNT